MIIDTSFFNEFYHAEKIESYSELMDYMSQFDEQFYKKLNIYYEWHHIIPYFECEDLDKVQKIPMPVLIHFKAHILRARMHKPSLHDDCHIEEDHYLMIGNYTEAFCILKPHIRVRGIMHKEFMEAKEHYQKYFKAETYEAQYGKKKADRIKKKISFAMSDLDPTIISKRNDSIKNYAANRPQSHNDAIAKGRQKSVIHIKTNKVYASAKDASKNTGTSINIIRNHCNGKIFDNEWEYLI